MQLDRLTGPASLLTISGIRVNAAMVGDGEDVMANVLVGGTAVNATPLKVADVTTGLDRPRSRRNRVTSARRVDGNDRATPGSRSRKGCERLWMANRSMTDGDSFMVSFSHGAYPDSFVVTISDVPKA